MGKLSCFYFRRYDNEQSIMAAPISESVSLGKRSSNYFYLSLRLLLYYVCEAIKNHTQYADGDDCLSF